MEQMKGYLVEVLRIAPELGKMGIFSSKLEEPLRNALRINKQRTYDETREIIRDRYLESCLIDELERLGERVRLNIMEPPQMEVSQLQESDVWILTNLQRLMDKVIPRTLVGRTSEAVEALKSFLSEDFNKFYMDNMEERLARGDPSALYTLYNVALSCLNMAAPLLPTQTEDVYQEYYRDLEGRPSVHVVMWPEVMMKLLDSRS
jgi:isoleucyl-tRNA synthetase